ncbi:MAG: acyl-[acyl-carrier-protein] thioesterase [Eubacteriales bacterium]
MNGIYTKDYLVHSYEVNYFHELFPEVILSYMQDIAMEQSESFGVGLEYLEQRKLFWILTRYYVKINTYPKYKDKVTITTKATGFNKMFAYRDFKIANGQGKTLITANSQWLLIDGVTHKMMRIPDEFYKAYGVDKEYKVMGAFEKLLQPQKSMSTTKFTAARSDIDFNRHVNNTRYIAWALNTIPEDIITNYSLAEFHIHFKKEVLLHQEISVKTDIIEKGDDLTGHHEFKNDQDEVVCSIHTSWTKVIYNKKDVCEV